MTDPTDQFVEAFRELPLAHRARLIELAKRSALERAGIDFDPADYPLASP